MSAARAAALLAAAAAAPFAAGAQQAVPDELADVSILARPGAQVPADVELVDQDGRRVRLAEYFDGKRPVILVMAYYSCPMLCTLVLNGLQEGMSGLAWPAGERFRVLTVSIDARDRPALAKQKRANYIKAYGRAVGPGGWDFLTGDEASVRRLADAVGFRYRWDEQTQQFAHAAGAFVLTADGRVSRLLPGVEFAPRDLRLALLEASEGRIGSAWDRVVMLCYQYDPHARGYALAARRLMRAGGVVVLAAVALLLLRLRRPGARRPQAPAGGTVP